MIDRSEKPDRGSDEEREGAFRCGSIAIIGRPNVGKSTLLNALVGARVSITSRKPQTTRHRIRGILSTPQAQFVFVDTPGYQMEHRNALNRFMNRGVGQAIGEVDCALLLVEAGRFLEADRRLLKLVPASVPLLLVVNKIDRTPRERLLPFLQETVRQAPFAEIVPVSAERRRGLKELLRTVRKYLPEQAPMFGEDEITDRDERFLAAELIREKLFRLMGDEIPYGSSVVIEKFEADPRLRRIHAAIVVDKEGHKPIVIGAGGEKLKRMATEARMDMQRLFGGKVHLEVWVKVRGGWTDDTRSLKNLGYE
ncbi:MAG: GTPase Era [Betaproteobacteria bacterium RIFCSPLOWO2_12_FULL_65_110]|nr:MAG: GTPase Era [Betaproteobacteria bacterium RIFCSPLOWO2_12_FULL_65_110]